MATTQLQEVKYSRQNSNPLKNSRKVLDTTTGAAEYENSKDSQITFRETETEYIYRKPRQSAIEVGARRFSGSQGEMLSQTEPRNSEKFLDPT